MRGVWLSRTERKHDLKPGFTEQLRIRELFGRKSTCFSNLCIHRKNFAVGGCCVGEKRKKLIKIQVNYNCLVTSFS